MVMNYERKKHKCLKNMLKYLTLFVQHTQLQFEDNCYFGQHLKFMDITFFSWTKGMKISAA